MGRDQDIEALEKFLCQDGRDRDEALVDAQDLMDPDCGPVAAMIAEAERRGAVKALFVASDAARRMYDPPRHDCEEWADWLVARARRIERGE